MEGWQLQTPAEAGVETSIAVFPTRWPCRWLPPLQENSWGSDGHAPARAPVVSPAQTDIEESRQVGDKEP